MAKLPVCLMDPHSYVCKKDGISFGGVRLFKAPRRFFLVHHIPTWPLQLISKKTRASRSIDQLWYYSNRDGTWQTHHLDRGWRMTYWKLQGTWSFEKAGFCSVQRSLNVNHELYDQNEKPHFNIQIRNSSKLMFKRYESTYIDQQAWNNNLDLLEGTIKS